MRQTSQAGQFIISLDCEGKWGMADKISSAHDVITHDALLKTYKDLVALFKKYKIKATFAFVGMFTLTEKERGRYAELSRDVVCNGENWYKHYRLSQKAGETEGWFCPEAWDIVSQTDHEIASHGFSHVPYSGGNVDRKDLAFDISAAMQVAKDKGQDIKTFIYPRNRIGHQDLLREAGLLSYRELLPPKGKVKSLLSELNIIENSQKNMSAHGGLQRIPSGYFFNWRSGPRKYVPQRATLMRWKSILNHAAKTGDVAHLWLHPHNLITAPDTMNVLKDVVHYAAKLQDAGQMQSVTQLDYTLQRH